MDNDELQALIAPAVEIEQPRVEVPAPEPAPEGPQRGVDGKFTARQADPAAAEKQPPLTEKETVGFYKAMQEERDKRQALEKEAADLKRQIAEIQTNEPPKTVTAEERMMTELQALRIEQQRVRADIKHGADKVQEAYDWAFKRCDEDQVFNTRASSLMKSNGNPYEVAVLLKQEADQLDALNNPPAAEVEPSPTPPPPEAPVPRSLATAPGNGAAGKAHIPVGEGQAYASVIK